MSTLIVTLLLICTSASAQSDPGLIGVGNWTGPLRIRFDEPAIAGQPVTARVPGDGCLQGGGPRIEPERTVITRAGTSIIVDLYSTTPICFSAGDPLGVWIYDQPLGVFEPGDYQVTARFHHYDSASGNPFATLAAPMAVRGGDPVALVARTPWSVGLLFLLLAMAGIHAGRMRRH